MLCTASASKLVLPALAAAALASAPLPQAIAAESVLRMRCDWQRSTDMQTLRSESTSGSSEFTYDPISDLTGTMTKQGLDFPFVASTGDRLIEGVAHYSADGAPAEQRVEINRYTGAIRNVIRTGKGGQLLEGKCIRLSGPSFGEGTGSE